MTGWLIGDEIPIGAHGILKCMGGIIERFPTNKKKKSQKRSSETILFRGANLSAPLFGNSYPESLRVWDETQHPFNVAIISSEHSRFAISSPRDGSTFADGSVSETGPILRNGFNAQQNF
jgi:hypothetical protein